jgi:hypothetical protein
MLTAKTVMVSPSQGTVVCHHLTAKTNFKNGNIINKQSAVGIVAGRDDRPKRSYMPP